MSYVEAIVQIVVAVIVVAIIAVIFGRSSQTATTIQQGSSAFDSLLKGAIGSIQ
jgi:PRD1 phage membrane DNA delivery